MTTRKRCLLVMPLHFYSFASVIGGELREMGYDVTLANEEYPQNLFGRVLGKLDLSISRWWTRRIFERRFLTGERWNLILIVKGRGVGPELVGDMKRHAGRVVGYHFDALTYDRATVRWGGAVDRVSTFDYRDAREQGWPLVELFSALSPPADPARPRFAISAIQRNHSGRLRYLDRVLAAFDAQERFVFLFERNWLTALANAVRQPRLTWKWRRRISLSALPYDEYRDVLASSDFTLDYAHPGQTGATMRCFEALALGVKLISNNANVVDSPLFDAGNVLLFPEDGDIDLLRRQAETLAGTRPKPNQRSPRTFLREILGED